MMQSSRVVLSRVGPGSHRTGLPVLVLLAASAATMGCEADGAATHLFVRDPHQVWVEAASNNGEEIVLPPGDGLKGVQFREGDANTRQVVSYATLFREPSGSITLDDRMCAPWPTSPLSSTGELRVMKSAGEPPFVSDGPTVRVPFLCDGPSHDKTTKVEITFVTPWTNVREVRIVKGELPPGVAPSTHPALQGDYWRASSTASE